jgi:hypothetical protein
LRTGRRPGHKMVDSFTSDVNHQSVSYLTRRSLFLSVSYQSIIN